MPMLALKRTQSRPATLAKPTVSGRPHPGRGQKARSSLSRAAHDHSRQLVLHGSPASIRAKLDASAPGESYERGPGPDVPRVVGEALSSQAQPLDTSTRGYFEERLGHDFGSTRIHVGDRASTAARSIHARAFTLGRDIVFDRGEYSPGTGEGRRLLAHELAHVAQQSAAPALSSAQARGDGADGVSMGRGAAADAPGSTRVGLSAPPMVSRGEKWDAFWDVGPLDAMKAKELADKALAAARKTGLPGLHNGPADAWRHCYWNCIMTDEIGRDQAKSIADNHEKHGGGPAVENLMDSRNNWEGRECGGSSCDPCCQKKLDTGVLDVIEGGKMVPSKATPRTGGKQSDKYTY